MTVSDVIFFLIAGITVGSAVMVAFSRNIVHSAFALMGTFLGVAGLYLTLGADFLGAVQVLVYVGGILVLMLFAVMLTHRIGDVEVSNRAVGRLPALLMSLGVFGVMVAAVGQANWGAAEPAAMVPTTSGIGHQLLTKYVLPFELASIVLLAALIAAVMLSRKEIRE
jgi:NAD(P)H-quinone oxidoreductase subunit 6